MRRHTPLALLLPLVLCLTIAPEAGASGPPSVGGMGAAPPPAPWDLRLNEVDYDQPGIDTGEFVEIVNVGSLRYRLRRVALVLVNGATSAEYRRVALFGRLGPRRRLVLATASVVVGGGARVILLPLASNNVQNGAPDGLALVDTANGVVLDALSYEGSLTEASIEGLAGTWSLVQGGTVSESDDNERVGALCRLPDETDTGDDEADWGWCLPTPGEVNAPPG